MSTKKLPTQNNSFQESVKNVVRNIPKGRVLSYKEVAAKAGNPKAARRVATIMSQIMT